MGRNIYPVITSKKPCLENALEPVVQGQNAPYIRWHTVGRCSASCNKLGSDIKIYLELWYAKVCLVKNIYDIGGLGHMALYLNALEEQCAQPTGWIVQSFLCPL